jgi:hypothetical protein
LEADPGAGLDHLAGAFVAQHSREAKALTGGSHVQVAAADGGRM